jgi:carbon storage regulator
MEASHGLMSFRASKEAGMLVLSRKQSQQIMIGSDISITVVKIEGNHVRLGIKAPRGISIVRDELVDRQNDRELLATGPAGRQGVHAW